MGRVLRRRTVVSVGSKRYSYDAGTSEDEITDEHAKQIGDHAWEGEKEEPGEDDDPQAIPQDNLDEMTVDDLKELAESEEIDLTGHTRKAEIITAIREARD